jgi:hypothetical protein
MRQYKEIEPLSDSTEAESALEHFPANRIAARVRVAKMRQYKELEPLSDSTEAESALAVDAMEVVRPGLSREAVVATASPLAQEPRMDVHQNARTTRHSRMLMVERLACG